MRAREAERGPPRARGSAPARPALDRLGLLLAAIVGCALALQPFALARPNRIAAAAPEFLWNALDPLRAGLAGAAFAAAALLLAFRNPPRLRLAAAAAALLLLGLASGWSARHLTPPGNAYIRVSPGGGAWLMLLAYALAVADALARLRLSPLGRLGALGIAAAALVLLLWSGAWDPISVMREYASRADGFRRELRVHALLALGSLAAAAIVGVPLGILCHRSPGLRGLVLGGLNLLQTIPSMALFGLLIVPLAWVAINLPGAAALGIAGIGPAPALIALVAYALLPVVSATVTGLEAVPRAVRDAADGMGMTGRQRLLAVELPLALPALLAGVRIVLVQNIGLAVIAGLVGGGGLGTFVFQGISQTATDLVLLGALPTVAMAFAAAIVLDACVELSRGGGGAA
ncbi:ABC transporter permease [Methylobacterium nigriterrae]|uniref:ABC transporter permease n=1 Tax=Methylobacterium nigriterrae TaxID=3127512 RepID=UPI0030138468